MIIYPFDDEFKEYWGLWKQYKKEQFKFVYKSVISEQAALNKLVRLAKGDKQTAMQIIDESMSSGWQGLYELKKQNLIQMVNEQTESYRDKLLKTLISE